MPASSASFLWRLKQELIDFGFLINTCDPCVANKLIEGSQMSVTWHVDNLKISHKKGHHVTNLLMHMKKLYRETIRVTRRKKHTYLGMGLDLSMKGVVTVSMESYVKKILEEFPETITKMSKT